MPTLEQKIDVGSPTYSESDMTELDPLTIMVGILILALLFKKLFWLMVAGAFVWIMGEEALGLLFVFGAIYLLFRLSRPRRARR